MTGDRRPVSSHARPSVRVLARGECAPRPHREAVSCGSGVLGRLELDEAQIAVELAVLVGRIANHRVDLIGLAELDASGNAVLVARALGVGTGPLECCLVAGVRVVVGDVRPDRDRFDLYGCDARIVDRTLERVGVLSDRSHAVLAASRERETLSAVGTPLTAAGLAAIDELLPDFGQSCPDERELCHCRR